MAKSLYPKNAKPTPNKLEKSGDPYDDFFQAMSKDGKSVDENIEYKLGEFTTAIHKGKYIEIRKFNKNKIQYTPTKLYPNGKVVKGDMVGEFKLAKESVFKTWIDIIEKSDPLKKITTLSDEDLLKFWHEQKKKEFKNFTGKEFVTFIDEFKKRDLLNKI